MRYIYLTMFDGIPFYVGQTGNPFKRYKWHYVAYGSAISEYIRYELSANGRLMTMQRLFTCNDIAKARLLENQVIQLYIENGFALYNRVMVGTTYPAIIRHPKTDILPHRALKNAANYII